MKRFEKSSALKDNNFIYIPAWVINHLGLTLNEAVIYSIMFSFARKGKVFNESIGWLESATLTSKPTIIKSINRLVNLGLIGVNITHKGTREYKEYIVNMNRVRNYYR